MTFFDLSLRSPFSAGSFSVAVITLATIGGLAPHAAAQHDEKHEHAGWAGDSYPLATDPVTGDSLGGEAVIIDHEGRELRFTNQANADKFLADPGAFLPALDQQIIESQMPYYPLTTCPISGDKLGGEMGESVDVVYRNRLVRFCCKSCVGDFKKDPEATIQKLNQAVIAQQRMNYPLTNCPVSKEALGSMGEPIDRVLAGRLMRMCCTGCRKDLQKNPAEILAVIDAAWAESGVTPSVFGEVKPTQGHAEHAGEKNQEVHGDGHDHH